MGRRSEVRINKREERKERLSLQAEKYKDKFREEREPPPIFPMNLKQQYYLEHLNNCNIIIVEGIFGTGKTYLAATYAADKLRRGEIEKIIVSRPYVQTGKTSGFKPGSSLEKLYPYVRNMLDNIRRRMGDGAYYSSLKDGIHGKIEVQELESIRGRSFDEKSFLLIDEAQQSTPEEMLSIITRISDDCTLVVMGDATQKDIKGDSGLEWLINFVKRHNLDYSHVGLVSFKDVDDIVRGGMVKEIAKGLFKDRKAHIYTPMAT